MRVARHRRVQADSLRCICRSVFAEAYSRRRICRTMSGAAMRGESEDAQMWGDGQGGGKAEETPAEMDALGVVLALLRTASVGQQVWDSSTAGTSRRRHMHPAWRTSNAAARNQGRERGARDPLERGSRPACGQRRERIGGYVLRVVTGIAAGLARLVWAHRRYVGPGPKRRPLGHRAVEGAAACYGRPALCTTRAPSMRCANSLQT